MLTNEQPQNKIHKEKTFLGIPLYSKTENNNVVERSYLAGLFRLINENGYKTTYYIGKLRIFKHISLSRKQDFIYHHLLERQELLLKKTDDIFYNMYVLQQVPTIHKQLLQYKNINQGKDIIIYAGGPSVKYYNNEFSSDKTIKCGVNGITALIPDLNYLITEDTFIQERDVNEKLDSYIGNNCQKFYGILPHRRLLELNRFEPFTERLKPYNIYNANATQFLISDVFKDRWAVNLETEAIGDFGGAIFSALQIMAYTKPKRIYLVGCDCTDAECAYPTRRKNPILHSFKIDGFKSFKTFATTVYPDIEIISINPIGLKGLFKDVYTESFLNAHPEIKP